MKKNIVLYTASFLVIFALILTSCSQVTTTSETYTTTTSLTLSTTTTTSNFGPWFDPTPYFGIPSADCKAPVTDLTGLSPALFNLIVDATKQIGAIDNAKWANVGTGTFYCAMSPDNLLLFEMNRRSGAFKYVRIFDIFSDGIGKWFFDAYPDFINTGVLPSWYYFSTPSDSKWLYREDANGNPIYNFWSIDGVLDSLLSAGIKPIFCVGYMPEALAEGEKVRTTGGSLVNTPNDYDKWRDLNYQTVKHCIERYGVGEVRMWYWELWNEPDIDSFFIDASKMWPGGDPQRYLKMYDYFAAGIKAADSQVKIGGPTIGFSQDWFKAFLSHCVNGTNSATGETGAPLDFIVWHGLWNIDTLITYNQSTMDIVRQFPSLKGIPIMEDEWGQPLLVMDAQGQIIEDYVFSEEEYTNHEAAFVSRFLDASLFDPENQPDLLARAGWLTSSTNTYRYFSMAGLGYFIPMPVLNTYLLLAKMGQQQLALTGSSYGDVVHGFATKTTNGIQVLLYNFDEADRYSKGASTEINLTLTGLSNEWSSMKRYQIDSQHSNAWTGFPFQVDFWQLPQSQLPKMQENSKLKITEQTNNLKIADGKVTLRLTLPVNSVSLIVIGEEAAPPVFSPSPLISEVIKEEYAYKAAEAMMDRDFLRAKDAFEQLANDSFAAVTDKSSHNPYCLWGQRALWALLDIAKNTFHNDDADAIRLRLLATSLTDVQRYVLLNERLKYLKDSGKQDEIQAINAEIQTLKERFTYFKNWTKYTRDWNESFSS